MRFNVVKYTKKITVEIQKTMIIKVTGQWYKRDVTQDKYNEGI